MLIMCYTSESGSLNTPGVLKPRNKLQRVGWGLGGPRPQDGSKEGRGLVERTNRIRWMDPEDDMPQLSRDRRGKGNRTEGVQKREINLTA